MRACAIGRRERQDMPDIPSLPAQLAVPFAAARRIRDAFAALAADPERGFHVDFQGVTPLPAALVRWLALQAVPDFDANCGRATFWHATLAETLDLGGTSLKLTLCFAACRLHGVALSDASVPGFEVIGGRLRHFHADRLTARGSVLLRGAYPAGTYAQPLPDDTPDHLAIPAGILLNGAKLRGNLDLRGAWLGPMPEEENAGPLAMLADGLEAEGNVLMREGFRARGEVRLNGAKIGRDLDANGAHLWNPHGGTLVADGARIAGSLLIGEGLRSTGTLTFVGARVEGRLDAAGGVGVAGAWDAPRAADAGDDQMPMALLADQVKVAGSVWLSGFRAKGAVSLVSAQIGGDFNCNDAQFEFPGADACNFDGASIGGGTDFSDVRSSGLIRGHAAQMKQGLVCDGLRFDIGGVHRGWAPADDLGADRAGLSGMGASVTGGLSWHDVRRVNGPHAAPTPVAGERTVWFAVAGASVDEVDDGRESWMEMQRIDLAGATYQRIRNLVPGQTWRVERLDAEYAPWNTRFPGMRADVEVFGRVLSGEAREPGSELGRQIDRFVPGPYLQLAAAFRAAGLERDAQRALLRLERNRTRYGGFGWAHMLWRWVLDGVLKYGQAPFRPIWLVLIWAGLSGAYFKWLHDDAKWFLAAQVRAGGKAVAIEGHLACHLFDAAKSDPHVHFNWVIYTLETLVPFMNLGQKSSFVVDPPYCGASWLLLANTVIGYAAAAFLAAGLSGLVRTGRG
jgi:hypothetical protein